ncbi:DEAD/DEAH box helicase [Larsenimonas rhizosphaerae]|uniref:DEAD-box ATP-dependent RNA helicase RhpA n=1 Tax=Larsenimonas rhizosphaerae TaxID=2944682 RepID=A0AA41ZIB9_9GAMM|nr:DEAD/DEAH box helicase [Larsenimonas rhizosphaerae]MCM2131368.1 DEAD/DEAH box helicase [Larsenimonas rhizosphaerae]MCX2525267.1 DEAD/DEAH box helicase [Larsenimonas rhizosphaerae]
MVDSMSFSELGLCPELLAAVDRAGYTTPSPIQEKAIPVCLEGRDVLAAAQTGTGKTAGFALPILQGLFQNGARRQPNRVQALILTPTRELAAQIGEVVEMFAASLPVRLTSAVVFGGVSARPQIDALAKGVDILVACPGRLLDLINQKAVRLDNVETLVLDEADRMLDMGFIHDIRKLMKLIPTDRQTLLFSATFSSEIRSLASGFLRQPVEIDITPRNSAAQSVEQSAFFVDRPAKAAALIHLIKARQWEQVLVFTATKHMANKVTYSLQQAGIEAAAIHGNKSQNARTQALSGFKDKRVTALVATDVAARGIDISELPQVVNFELPATPADYVHRIGRTGRAGAAGQAISLVDSEEKDQLRRIERLIKSNLPKTDMSDFDEASAKAQYPLLSPPRGPKPVRKAGGGNGRGKPSGGGRNGGGNASGNRAGGAPSGGQPSRNRRPRRSGGNNSSSSQS